MIKKIDTDKKRFLDILLLGDEQEDMIDRYINRGDMFALFENDSALKSVCVVTREDNGIYEIKNIATYPLYQRQGCAKKLIEFICDYYKDDLKVLYVGTGDTIGNLIFYAKCGFKYSHRVKDFFLENYSRPVIEDGRLLKDMLYLKKIFN